MSNRLAGKVALITGGGSGIGREIAITFAREGASVAICGRSLDPLAKVVVEIEAIGGTCRAIQCDVSQSTEVEAMFSSLKGEFDRLHVLVNNAGVRASIGTIESLTEEEWERTFDIDAKGSWLCSKYAIPLLRQSGGGSILMISSISAYVGQAKQGCYNAAKAAQELLMKCMAIDFAADGVRVNSICPAWVRTEMNRQQLQEMESSPDRVFANGMSFRDVQRLHPIGRIGEPLDVAWAAVYLASDESRWVTGASFMIDGGYTVQ